MAVTTGNISVPGTSASARHSPNIIKQGVYETSSEQLHLLGTRVEVGERVFHYAKAGGVALAASKLNQGAVPVSDHLKCILATTAAVGDMRLKITLNGTTVAAINLYSEGYINLDNGGGGYGGYKIKAHPAFGAGDSQYVNLYDPIQVALTASMYATLTKNPWKDVVVMPTTKTSIPIGVNLVAVTAAYYFWAQTWGPCSCLLGAGPASIGEALMASGATAGSLITATAGYPVVGNLMRAEAAADYGLVFLTIAP